MSQGFGRRWLYIWRTAFAVDRWAAVVVLASAPLVGIAEPFRAYALKAMTDGILGGSHARAFIAAGIAAALTVGAMSAGMPVVKRWIRLQELGTQEAAQDVTRIVKKFRTFAIYEEPRLLDLLQQIRNESWTIGGVVGVAANASVVTGQAVVATIFLAAVTPLLLFLPATAAVSVACSFLGDRIAATAERESANAARRAHGIADPLTRSSQLVDVLANGIGRTIARRASAAWAKHAKTAISGLQRSALVASSGWIVFAAGYGGALWIVASRVHAGTSTAGDLLLVLLLGTQLQAQLTGMVQMASMLRAAGRAASHVVMLEAEATMEVNAHDEFVASHRRPAVPALQSSLVFDRVGFRYPSRQVDALADVTIELPLGESVALVGANGAGKSTFVKLLARFYEPTSGCVRLDGRDAREFDLESWRKLFSAAFQDFARLELTVRSNVALRADDPSEASEERVWKALEVARADKWARDLPFGLDTTTGSDWQGGVGLSSGQWQRLAIARAAFAGSSIELLDEPTATLDAFAEADVYEAFTQSREVIPVRTNVFVSHRFGTVRAVDRILVLCDGRLVEAGSHESLMQQRGQYRQLYELQQRALGLVVGDE